MARTRGTANQANHELPRERKTDASGKKASKAKNKKYKTTAQPQKVKHREKRNSDAAGDTEQGKKKYIDKHSNDEEDFSMVESEEYDSDDYYPTKIAKKRDTQKLDARENKGAVIETSQPAQKQLISKMSHKSHKSSLPPSSSIPPTATKMICIACHDAHAKCRKSDVPGQPCDRCARMGLECEFDPHYKRRGRRPKVPVEKTTTGQQSSEKSGDIGDSSSEDPLNSPVPTIRAVSRQTSNKNNSTSGRFTKAARGNDHSPPSSPLSSAPEDSQDEKDIRMPGAKQKTNEHVDVPSTPNIRNKPRTPRSAARKGPSPGIPAPNRYEANNRLDDHDLPSSMTDVVPKKGLKFEDFNNLPGNKPVPIEKQDQGKEQETSCDDTAIDSASNPDSVSHFHSASPSPTDAFFANQQIKDFTLASPRIKQNTPTFLPKGHGSVLNPDMIPEQQQQQQQHSSPLPPISQLGPGGAYRGRYDITNFPLPPPQAGLTHDQASQVPIMTSSQNLPAPPNIITNKNSNNHTLFYTSQSNTNTSPLTSPSNQADMPAPGSLAYRYNATKILFLLKHSQRTQLLAVGGLHIAPDAIATLTYEMEDARSRALRMWLEMHNGLAVGEEMYE